MARRYLGESLQKEPSSSTPSSFSSEQDDASKEIGPSQTKKPASDFSLYHSGSENQDILFDKIRPKSEVFEAISSDELVKIGKKESAKAETEQVDLDEYISHLKNQAPKKGLFD